MVGGEGLFEIRDGFDLAGAHACGGSGWAAGMARSRARSVSGSASQAGERFRPMERKHPAGAGFGIAFVAKEGFNSGGFVKKRQRGTPAGGLARKSGRFFAVMAGLFGDTRKSGAGLLGLDDADGFAVHEEQVIARAGLEGNLPKRDAAASREINCP